MQSPDHPTAAGGPARLDLLLDLAGDASPIVWRQVRRELAARGPAARAGLRRIARQGPPRARARARRLLLRESRERAARRLVRFAAGGAADLERGLLLLSRFADPDFDARRTLAALDALGAEVQRRVEGRPPDARRALELAAYLGRELGYEGDVEDYHHPDNVVLHRVVERRRGLPLSLVALYLACARRAGIPAAAVALPGHVVLRLRGRDRHVLVDPFRRGDELSERDCLTYLAEHGLPFRAEWFADAPDAALFARQVRNLIESYRQRALAYEVRLLGWVLRTLEREAERPRVAREVS